MSDETTNELTIPKDDPRRLLRAGDEAKAYPESALYRVYEREIDAIRKFLAELDRRHLAVCRQDDDLVKIRYEGDEFEYEDNLWHAGSSTEVERIMMATFDIDEDERQRELNIMLHVLHHVNPPDETQTMTVAQSEELYREIKDKYGSTHPTRLHVSDYGGNEDGTGGYLVVSFKHPGQEEGWAEQTIQTRKQLRTLVAQLAQEYADAKHGKTKK